MGQIAAVLLTGSCIMQSESGSVPCVHCSSFGKINREAKATRGVTDDRRPYTSQVVFIRVMGDNIYPYQITSSLRMGLVTLT